MGVKMVKCARCGGKLRRIHRTFFERLGYMAVYECRTCQDEQVVLRRYRYHFGAYCRCPQCGTYKITRLKEPDRIDPMVGGVLNFLELLAGGRRLCHCRYCRIQFYDRREIAPGGPGPSPFDRPAGNREEFAAGPVVSHRASVRPLA